MARIIILLLCTLSLQANTTINAGPIQNFSDIVTMWLQGSLGYIIAFFGVFGSIMWYIVGENILGEGSLRSLWIGITVSFFTGGIIGIVQTMVKIGGGTFS